MNAFHFRLQRALELRRTQLELAEARFKQQTAALAALDHARAELAASAVRTEVEVRRWDPISASDLAALGAFRLDVRVREAAIAARRSECVKQLAAQEAAM